MKTKKTKAKKACPAVREARQELNRFYVVIGTKKIAEMEGLASVQCGYFVRTLQRIIKAK